MAGSDTTSKRVPLFFPLDETLKGEGPFAPSSDLLQQLKQQLDLGVSAQFRFTFERDILI
jgi:hypothetical protein